MMFRKNSTTCLLFLIVVMLAACGSPSSQPPQATVQIERVEPAENTSELDSYPAAQEVQEVVVPVVDSAYPVEETVAQPITVQPVTVDQVPQPQADSAVVTGFLTDIDGLPYIGTLYAAETIESTDPGFPPLISFSEEESALAIQDSTTGQFVFETLAPGDYGLILWSPVGNTVVDDTNTGHSVLFTVSAGESVDLGTIQLP